MTKEHEQAIQILQKEYLCVDRDCDIERSCGKCDLMMPSKEPILKAYKVAIQAIKDLDKMNGIALDLASENDDLIEKIDAIRAEIDVLDKIITEIDENISHYEHFLSSNTANGLKIAKKIINKYRKGE